MKRVSHKSLLTLALTACLSLGAGAALASDPHRSTTGTGTVQSEDGSTFTQRGGTTGPTTGRNEHSGSGTGAVREPEHAEPLSNDSRGPHQLGSQSSPEASQRAPEPSEMHDGSKRE
jgi:hypothetical protein